MPIFSNETHSEQVFSIKHGIGVAFGQNNMVRVNYYSTPSEYLYDMDGHCISDLWDDVFPLNAQHLSDNGIVAMTLIYDAAAFRKACTKVDLKKSNLPSGYDIMVIGTATQGEYMNLKVVNIGVGVAVSAQAGKGGMHWGRYVRVPIRKMQGLLRGMKGTICIAQTQSAVYTYSGGTRYAYSFEYDGGAHEDLCIHIMEHVNGEGLGRDVANRFMASIKMAAKSMHKDRDRPLLCGVHVIATPGNIRVESTNGTAVYMRDIPSDKSTLDVDCVIEKNALQCLLKADMVSGNVDVAWASDGIKRIGLGDVVTYTWYEHNRRYPEVERAFAGNSGETNIMVAYESISRILHSHACLQMGKNPSKTTITVDHRSGVAFLETVDDMKEIVATGAIPIETSYGFMGKGELSIRANAALLSNAINQMNSDMLIISFHDDPNKWSGSAIVVRDKDGLTKALVMPLRS